MIELEIEGVAMGIGRGAEMVAAVTVSRKAGWLGGQRRFPGELRLPAATTIVRVSSRTGLKPR
ncbi:hypothetical protein FJ437_15900 [Mesorhizobium sp. B2-6-6]|nr:hypothetical protein FJ437_15900 [Mesorhizobium sp. B2-6-6]TPJ52575.1 hypothetical protein FJ462_33330 [Mesorhizobium sp. B2-6-7]